MPQHPSRFRFEVSRYDELNWIATRLLYMAYRRYYQSGWYVARDRGDILDSAHAQTKPGYVKAALYVSRIKTLVEIAADSGSWISEDLTAFLAGFTSQEVTEYCSTYDPHLFQ